MDQETRLVIDSRAEEVPGAREWLSRWAVGLGLPPEFIDEIRLAFTEALTNVIRHAYALEAGHPIVLGARAESDAVTVTIRDFGRKFDLDRYSPPDPGDAREGGYGIFIIHHLMDEVHYDTTLEQGTCLRMVKRLRQRPAEAGPTAASP